MRRAIVILVAVTTFFFYAAQSSASEVEDLKNAVDEMQSRLEVLEAEQVDAGEKTSQIMEISGYADVEYIMTDEHGKNNEFRVHHLSLQFLKQISEQWSLFSEIEYEDGPFFEANNDGTTAMKKSEGKIFVEVMSLNYNYSPKISFRLGRFFTPAGIWNIDHYPPFVSTQERPQHIRKIFPQVVDGVLVHGGATLGNTPVNYSLYIGNGEGNNGNNDGNEDKAVGGRLTLKLPALTLTEVGVSGFTDTNNSNTEKSSYGVDLKVQWKNLKFQGEYATASVKPLTGTGYDISGYYGQAIYGYKSWDFIYRYDWYDPKDSVDNDEATINTLAVNYHFTPKVVAKAEHHIVGLDDPAKKNYTKTILSVAVFLGR